MSNSQQVFEAWLAAEISSEQCRLALAADPAWLARFETAHSLQQMAQQPMYQPVPVLDVSTMFKQQWGHRKVKTSWWPQFSVAFSALAIVISLSPLKLQLHNGAIALKWQQTDDQQVATQVATALATYKTEQQQYMQQQFTLQQQQQTAQLVLLKDYLTETEQKNRRGDMVELVEYLNQQRQADWQYWQDHMQPSQARLDYNNPTVNGADRRFN